MRLREEVISELVRRWFNRADADFGVAELLTAKVRYLSAVGFYTQQAAEKYLKAYLTEHQIEFPKTHSIKELLNLVALKDRPLAESLRSADVLSPYGADIRYPGDIPDLTLEMARAAVAEAARLRRAICASLGRPPSA